MVRMSDIIVVSKPYPHEALFFDLAQVHNLPLVDFGYGMGPITRYRADLFLLSVGLEDDEPCFPALDRYMLEHREPYLALYPEALALATALKQDAQLAPHLEQLVPLLGKLIGEVYPRLATPLYVFIRRSKKGDLYPNPPAVFTLDTMLKLLLAELEPASTWHQFLRILETLRVFAFPTEELGTQLADATLDVLYRGVRHQFDAQMLLKNFGVIVAFCQASFQSLLRQFCLSSLNDNANRFFESYEAQRLALGAHPRIIERYNAQTIANSVIITYRLPHHSPRPLELMPHGIAPEELDE